VTVFNLLQQFFGVVCGQNPTHSWALGGVILPFCQRCTGLYLGAFVAALLHSLWRPAPTARWLWLNGGFLILMVPFGFHWLPQGPAIRTITGVLFGFGLVGFLTLLPFANARRTENYIPHLLGVLATAVLVPWLGARRDALAGNSLALLSALGLLVLAALVLANLALALRGLIRRFSRQPLSHTKRAAP
jgi:uncharacterized membrane protein